ncbi:MAG: spermidine/putrescine transport system substrate-binding protein [Cryptosporangiaceae bacterium]|nr:spermidine/putrescine transport system substrate-binding protein [Cryptosporangiaceae bacterium]
MTEYPTAARLRRRTLLRGAGAALLAGPLLTACGGPAKTAAEKRDRSDKDKWIAISNRPGFIDHKPPTGTRTRVTKTSSQVFSAASKVQVRYHEDIADDAQYLARITPSLKAAKDISRDVVILPDWLAARAAKDGLASKLDHVAMYHIRSVVAPFQHSAADPQRDYTIPWIAGITGIAYDSSQVTVTTVQQLLTARALRGKVTGSTDMRNMLGLAIAADGGKPSAPTAAQVSMALGKLRTAVRDGQFLRFAGADYTADLISGRAVAAVASSLDLRRLTAANPAIRFIVPESGGMLWSRDAFVPNGSVHQSNVNAFLDGYYQPPLAAQFVAAMESVNLNAAVEDEMVKLKPVLLTNPLVFPSEPLWARLSIFAQLDAKTDAAYSAAFRGVIAKAA